MPLPRVVLDTDTFNEVDDQFALAHLLLSPEQVQLEAVYAAPFHNDRSSGPAEGMERSYEEIHRVLDMVKTAQRPPVYRGSTAWLLAADRPVESEMVADLISRAHATPAGERLMVVAIGAITNVASALLTDPGITEKIEVVWLGGHAPYWYSTNEFNLRQDLHAARVVLDSKAPLVLIPCLPVASHLLTTVAELEELLAPFSPLGRYLTDIVRQYNPKNLPAWSKEIWDISASAWAINPDWLPSEEAPSPVLRDDLTWDPTPGPRHLIRIARKVNRNQIFADFFAKAKTMGA